jgi:hypothetical protein
VEFLPATNSKQIFADGMGRIGGGRQGGRAVEGNRPYRFFATEPGSATLQPTRAIRLALLAQASAVAGAMVDKTAGSFRYRYTGES